MKKISIELYEWDIYFCTSKEEYIQQMKKLEQTDYDFINNADGIHSYFGKNNRYISVIGLNIDLIKENVDNFIFEAECVFVHEITHAMQYIKDCLNLKCNENEATVTMYLYREFMPYLRDYLNNEKIN